MRTSSVISVRPSFPKRPIHIAQVGLEQVCLDPSSSRMHLKTASLSSIRVTRSVMNLFLGGTVVPFALLATLFTFGSKVAGAMIAESGSK